MATNKCKLKSVPMMILFLLSFAVCKAQTDISFNYPSDNTPFELKAKDSRGREVGYFKYNQVTDRVSIRGNIKPAWNWFVTKYFLPNWEVFNAQQKVIELIDWDGTIKDLDAFKNAIAEYRRIKLKYGM